MGQSISAIPETCFKAIFAQPLPLIKAKSAGALFSVGVTPEAVPRDR
jgi:hypothetical protein